VRQRGVRVLEVCDGHWVVLVSIFFLFQIASR
jgi:hypothetical protein